MRAAVQAWIRTAVGSESTPATIFARLENALQTHCERRVASVMELKKRSTKEKGDLFEVLAALYMESRGYTVYSLNSSLVRKGDLPPVPSEYAAYMGLPKVDSGIDFVVLNPSRQPIAVQAKYRHCANQRSQWNPHGKTAVTWTDLSTFYALCERTGPWYQRWVITNCHYVDRRGKKNSADYTVARGAWESIPVEEWRRMGGGVSTPGYALTDQPASAVAPLSREQVAALRAARFETSAKSAAKTFLAAAPKDVLLSNLPGGSSGGGDDRSLLVQGQLSICSPSLPGSVEGAAAGGTELLSVQRVQDGVSSGGAASGRGGAEAEVGGLDRQRN